MLAIGILIYSFYVIGIFSDQFVIGDVDTKKKVNYVIHTAERFFSTRRNISQTV